MIELRGVTKRYAVGPAPGRPPRVVEALRDVDLVIPEGRVSAVVGPNGAGKSTLFGVLLGFVFPTEGEVRIRGDSPRRYMRRRGAAFLPERFQLPGEWTVRATLRALCRLEGLRGREVSVRADAALARLGLDDHAAKPLSTLSRGLLQRVGIAQALIGMRELVVLDEPTNGLDPLWRIRFRAIVEELRDNGRTVLLASHDLAEVERLADRVVLLEGGTVVDILELRGENAEPPASRTYRLELASPVAAITEIFPTAVHLDEEGVAAYRVEAGDATELSARLAALLAAGGILESIRPEVEALEARVQRVLAEGGGRS